MGFNSNMTNGGSFGTFHLSPHEIILTIALVNIHYLYTIDCMIDPFWPVRNVLQSPYKNVIILQRSTLPTLSLHNMLFSKDKIKG
jgi:hypothetical protein